MKLKALDESLDSVAEEIELVECVDTVAEYIYSLSYKWLH